MKKLLTTLFCLLMPLAWAQDNYGLLLAPTYLVFQPNQSVQTLTVTNRSLKHVNHTITLDDEVMGANGGTSMQKEGFAYSVRKMVRFSPNVLDLKPGESQIVRIMVRRPAGLEAGDYHSHLIFNEQLPDVSQEVSSSEVGAQKPEAKFVMSTLLTLGIPLIVQHGEPTGKLELVGLKPWVRTLENGNAAPFEIDIKRSGNSTGVGFLTLKDPKGEDIMVKRRVSVYREVDAVTLSLQPTEYGRTYKGPAKLTLYGDSNERAPVVKALDVQIQ